MCRFSRRRASTGRRIAQTYQGDGSIGCARGNLQAMAAEGRWMPTCTAALRERRYRRLLLSGEADPVTPPADAAARGARDLRTIGTWYLTGEGHGQVATGCVPQLMAEFLETAAPGDARRDLSRAASSGAFLRELDRARAMIEASDLSKRFGAIEAVARGLLRRTRRRNHRHCWARTVRANRRVCACCTAC